MIAFIWISLAVLTAGYSLVLINDVVKHKGQLENSSWLKTGLIGFVVNFFDVLGIGAFAPQTALLKFSKQTEDRVLPGTLNVANTIPVLVQALIFITVVEVEPTTLILMLVSAAAGAILGRCGVQIARKKDPPDHGLCLAGYRWIYVCPQHGMDPGRRYSHWFAQYQVADCRAGQFYLRRLDDGGHWFVCALYGPGVCAGHVATSGIPDHDGLLRILMPRRPFFIREGAHNRKAAIGMAIPGIVAVLIAAFIVKSLPLDTLRWVVIVVILYTSVVMLRAGYGQKKAHENEVKLTR
nr:sulfite exporter TauE/SafE family protein [Haliscomenobacter sp.]